MAEHVYRPRPPDAALTHGIGLAFRVEMPWWQRVLVALGLRRVYVAVWIDTDRDPGDIRADPPRVALGTGYPAILESYLRVKRLEGVVQEVRVEPGGRRGRR